MESMQEEEWMGRSTDLHVSCLREDKKNKTKPHNPLPPPTKKPPSLSSSIIPYNGNKGGIYSVFFLASLVFLNK